jgi:exodeoxyribonuclease VII small subunit
MEVNITYDQAFAELETIATAIQNETVSIDELSEKVKRASELIEFCQKKLRSTETEVNKIIEKMQKEKK